MKKATHRISFDGMRPLALNKKQAIAALGSSKLVARMLWASRYAGDQWLILARQGRDLLIDTASVESAYERLLRGEQPPLMPSERRLRYSNTTTLVRKNIVSKQRMHTPGGRIRLPDFQ